MQFVDLFYCVFWVSFISIIWFYTDTLLYYSQLCGLFEDVRLEYSKYVSNYADKYFPDFLFYKGLQTDNRFLKFACKLLSCPFCTTFWLSLAAAVAVHNLLLVAPIYVVSMFILLAVKKLL